MSNLKFSITKINQYADHKNPSMFPSFKQWKKVHRQYPDSIIMTADSSRQAGILLDETYTKPTKYKVKKKIKRDANGDQLLELYHEDAVVLFRIEEIDEDEINEHNMKFEN